MEPVIAQVEKMGDPDFELKVTSKDLQGRWQAIEKWSKEQQNVLRSILGQWESLREHLKTLIEWIDLKDIKLKELKEQVNLADEEEVKGELTELKVRVLPMQSYLNQSQYSKIFFRAA